MPLLTWEIFLWAPPKGSEMSSSTNLSFNKLSAVIHIASAAKLAFSGDFNKIDAQP